MTFGRLLFIAFPVALIASVVGALVLVGVEPEQARYGSNAGAVFMSTLIASTFPFFGILAVLGAIFAPIALVLDKAGVPAIVRDLLFVLLGVVPAFIVPRDPGWGIVVPLSYVLTASLLWVAALHFLARKAPRQGARNG